MTETAEPALTSEPPHPQRQKTAFEQWLDLARPRAQLWRTILGLLLVVLIWAGWTLLILLAAILARALSQETPLDGETLTRNLITGATPADSMVLLTTFFGLWLGVWASLSAFHARRFRTVFSVDGRIHWGEFGLGVAIITAYLALNFGVSLVSGMFEPHRSDLSLQEWAMVAAPVALLIFFQSTGEEIFFRGYLVQNLAARFRHPLVWAVLPAILFGLGHIGGDYPPAFAAYYVLSTMMIGLIGAAMVWRTGGISAAMGMHVANNFAAFLIAGTDDSMNSTQLWLAPIPTTLEGAPIDLAMLVGLLVYVLSPWSPFPRRRNETRAAP